MNTLINTLTEQTQSFKAEYISKTKAYAARYFDFVASEVKRYSSEGNSLYKNSPNEYYTLQKKVYGVYTRIQNKGVAEFINEEVKNAEAHYNESIEKLAYRITQKGLTLEALVVKSGHVGVNLEITFTDSVKTVRAFTIIAEGPIQRPHYRYLIK